MYSRVRNKRSPLSNKHYVISFKSTVKILSIFVAFLENTNFNKDEDTEKTLKN